jgi:alpha-ribazole phosphatase
MSCRVYLVRHGETEWNTIMKAQGHSDVPLSDAGRRQADCLGKRLATEKFKGLYASDLKRARETAAIISKHQQHNCPAIETLPELRELNFGEWEGMTMQEVAALFNDDLKRWWENPVSVRIPGGETMGELADRCLGALKQIVRRHNGGNVLIVTHGGPIRTITASVLEMDLNKYWRLQMDNACLSIIDFPHWEKGILMLFNDCSHLTFTGNQK